MFQKLVRSVYRVIAWSLVGGLVFQVYLAGLGVFRYRPFGESQSFYGLHIEFGFLLGLVVVLMLILAILGRLPRPIIGRVGLLLLLNFLQSVILFINEDSALIRALHPVNAIAIGLVSLWLARRSSNVEDTSEESTFAVEKQPA